MKDMLWMFWPCTASQRMEMPVVLYSKGITGRTHPLGKAADVAEN